MRPLQRDFHRQVAIDGPAASGKSSVARELARRLGFIYVNSGAIYRAITWYLLQKGVHAEKSDRIAHALESAAITCCLQDSESRILIDNVDPADHLRDDRVNESVARARRTRRNHAARSRRFFTTCFTTCHCRRRACHRHVTSYNRGSR